jgi:hypothetical protein
MELVEIELAKVTYLTKLHRPAGSLYQPEAIAKLVQRYMFAKYPSIDDLTKNVRPFAIGKFKDIQINEFSIYNDGIIVSSASNSNILDEFIDDLFGWAREEFGLVPTLEAVHEKTYESSMIVKAESDISKVVAPSAAAIAAVNKAYGSDRYPAVELAYSGFVFSVDGTTFPGVKKPNKLIVDKRLNMPVDQNLFYSQAPLPTDDHFDLLRTFERLASAR